jgi:hypothetical protein
LRPNRQFFKEKQNFLRAATKMPVQPRNDSKIRIACEKGEFKMTNYLRIAAFMCAGMLALTVPQARASEMDQKTVFTFNQPVEVPGQVLSAGTYVFKLADSSSDRNIVQVFDKNETELYGTFLTIPDSRLEPADKPIITFEERESGSPEAVKAWFYPGDNYGHEFVYPKTAASALAKANNQPVPSMPDQLAANTTRPVETMQEPHVVAMKQPPLKAQKPTEEEVEIAEVFTIVTGQPSAPAPRPAAQLPAELPHTASPLPLIGMLGILALGTAFVLHLGNRSQKRSEL